MTLLLAVEGLRRPPLPVLSLAVAAGECVAVTGPSGAGKSLLLRAIADLDPNDGRVSLAGTDRAALPAPEWRQRVAYVAAESGWWAPTVADHMAGPPDRLATLLAAVGLPEAGGWPVARLSSGERQRLALVRALTRRPEVLLLDEPTANLDAAATESVEALVRQALAEGCGVLLASHDRNQVRRLAGRELAFRDGALTEVRP
ncbi:ATP-binding cassette domain-containing protein [Caenispirillum bisanense]|uniref:ABC-type iron transport system FetAB, ATPase component n=1 Tax=Caenispirillum bisanense TaxID=414052 RepID=A0A286H153_9PROT|nr:ABC transporter ATP-binding protein [Caenispirillum bisanense]SOE01034.1 ABC-type iron transport system FetAB, ATPase component [Caenispirillum bisanense]